MRAVNTRHPHLYPLTWAELPRFDLPRYLRWGGLPTVVQSQEPGEELGAYVRTYLQDEIQAEGFVRRLPQFARFLATAALTNGRRLNFAAIASDAGVPAATVREYYFLLEDTLVGFLLPAWTKSRRRKAISTRPGARRAAWRGRRWRRRGRRGGAWTRPSHG